MKEGQDIDSITFLLSGVLEVYTTFEGNDFIVERLYQGSIINYRNFVTHDKLAINIRCVDDAKTLELK